MKKLKIQLINRYPHIIQEKIIINPNDSHEIGIGLLIQAKIRCAFPHEPNAFMTEYHAVLERNQERQQARPGLSH